MRQPTSVLVYIAHPSAQNQYEFLLLKRRARPDRGLDSFWQGVTGAVEGDESIEEAAARELGEETGYVAERLVPIGFVYSFPLRAEQRGKYPPGTNEITEHVFLAIISNPPAPALSIEHDEWRWRSLDEAIPMLSYEENAEALRRCADLLDRS